MAVGTPGVGRPCVAVAQARDRIQRRGGQIAIQPRPGRAHRHPKTGHPSRLTVAKLSGAGLLMVEKHYGHLLREHAAKALVSLTL